MRTTLVSLGLVVVAAIAGTVLLGAGRGASVSGPGSAASAGTSTPAAVIVPFTKLAKGAHSSVERRANYLITTTEGLHELWTLLKAPGKEPKVDFDTYAVVAVFAGQEPTAGYAISVEKIEDADARKVIVQIAKPEGCVLAQALTAPYEIVQVAKTPLSFTHADLAATTTCPK